MIKFVYLLMAMLVLCIVVLGWALNTIEQNEKELRKVKKQVKLMGEIIDEDHVR